MQEQKKLKSQSCIHGIGVDIVDVSRIEAAAKKWGNRFLKRVFTETELAYCFKKAGPYTSLAARFAAKEAFIKALQADVVIPLQDIETLNNEKGVPSIRLYGRAEEHFKRLIREGNIHLSLSHDRSLAIAFVIIEVV
ncbi:MAG: holo-[acyl-carrier-protein] synthase [Nitrospirae bacterium]|nr:holo-[acyl-carrier-protein] synthase [Nitrospirota bacterium]